MRFPLLAAAVLLASACATTAAKTSPAATPTSPAPPPLALSALTIDQASLTGFTLHGTGTLGPGVDGSSLDWTATDDSRTLGQGKLPVTVGDDRTFTFAIPIVLGKTADDLKPYQSTDDETVTLNATLGGVTASQTVPLRSPHIPNSKVLTVQGTLSSPTTIDMSFLYAIDNTNLYEVQLNSVDYKAYLGDKLIADAQLPMSGNLKQSEQTEFTIPMQANTDNCGKDFHAMAKATSLPWRFTGVMHYPTFDVPFDLNGTLELSRTE